MHDISHKTEVSLDDFIEAFLPRLPEGININDVLRRVKKTAAWQEFSSLPANDPSSENQIFQRLTPLFNEMVNAAKTGKTEDPKQRWALITDSTSMPNTTERPTSIKPDAFFHCMEGRDSKPYSYYNMAFTAEFKKQSGVTNALDNISKLIYETKHIMGVDARRRFMFGITIENSCMGLWYTNRAMLVSSRLPDIIKEKEIFLKVFLSFAFARDEEMGFDPTVMRLEKSYHIRVGVTLYKTIGVLQDCGTDILLSRGARVFVVQKVNDTTGDEKAYVLKDLWMEKSRRPEHEIYENIIRDVRDQYSETDTENVKRHLLTPVDSAIVEVDNAEDETEISMMRGHALESAKVVPLPINTPSYDPARNSKGFADSSDIEVNRVNDIKLGLRKPEKIRHRRHYRVVFEECATCLHEVENMGDVFTVLADLIKVFQFIHGSGWVHRDVSVGNVYFGVNEQDANLLLPFRYNAIHDLEAVWWVGIWIMFFNKPEGYAEPEENARTRQPETRLFFPSNLGLGGRLRLLYDEVDLKRLLTCPQSIRYCARHASKTLRRDRREIP